MSVGCIASTYAACLSAFAPCFTAPTFQSFQIITSGWLLCLGKRTISGLITAADAVGFKHHTSFGRFFRLARWSADEVGLTLLRLVLSLVADDQPLFVAIDDTLARHTGKCISSAGMHRDPLLSTAKKVVYHFGHVWVVLAVVVTVPRWNKSFALPVLVRLYRSVKVCKQQKRKHQKKTEMAATMIRLLCLALHDREVVIVGDSGYANRAIVRPLPHNAHFIGRSRMDAALYAPPPERKEGQMGRPRVKGDRLFSPEQRIKRAKSKDWKRVEATLYGKPATVQVLVFDALWYKVGHSRLMRLVVIRGWPGHEKDDVLVCTDTSRDARWIIEAYCLRWTLEVTFFWSKGRLGLEDPQNRSERAVVRTAPLALWSYSLVVCWYLKVGQQSASAMLPSRPWYRQKRVPAFSDMLAAIRRESWRERLLDQAVGGRFDQKSVDNLLDMMGYAA